ncbi:chromosome segregation protein SMC [Fundicoccus culcitae]|uniref:Chromosome partition protein Smc n=1 Tax=Fundicoccus culcitae TaxID=2969821 RepID=A0ABY5P6P5_9LACT|nr:chromosome segregation protein SMC [Fundicoccus culcitae]UUX34098.1 chromosome segregation protein SMC [Fundicoccus culcitae]
MYLSRIEMTGFKSFADKTVIEFDKGITAVVGPNGSGKSNLSEAIRWVLGEQSAKSLRGSKMEDVIFNGTQQRKAVNLAKVTIVLNNEDRYLDYDFSEISIARSYNRNGESHYSINNESCRLKDIVDLLLDSGLGKNNFSMISQGKVENIFLNKPEERRAIFEEAAGVQKYQMRKLEAERKLNKSADHLSRVKDIIHELSSQLAPLKKQREAALIYQERQKQLSQLEISLYTYQIDIYRKQWHETENELEKVSDNIEVFDTQLLETKSELQTNQTLHDTLVQKIDESADQSQSQIQFLEQSKAKQQILSQQISFKTASKEEKQQQHDRQLEQKDELNKRLEQANLSYKEMANKRRTIKTTLAELNNQKDLFSDLGKSQVEAIRSELIDWYQQEATSKNQLTQNQNNLYQLDQQGEKLIAKQNQAETTLKQIEESKANKEIEVANQSKTVQAMQEQAQGLSDGLQQAKNQRSSLQKVLFDHERLINNLSSRLDSLKQMQSDYSGYYSGVRAVMKQARQLTGIEGTVADLIDVPNDYQIALDQALGASMQHIVVKDDAAAKRAINYLKQQRSGRATFLPKTNIKSRYLNQRYLEVAQTHSGFVGVASELVQYHPDNQAIVENLLGTTVIMSSIDMAQALAKQLNFQVKIVTLAGEVLMPGGSISGGQSKQTNQSMLNRQNELKSLEDQYQQALQKQKEYEHQWQLNEEVYSKYEEQTDAMAISLNQAQSELRTAEHELVNLESEHKQIQQQFVIINSDLKDHDSEKTTTSQAIQTFEAAVTEAKDNIQQLNDTLSSLTVNEEERRQKLQELEQSIQASSTQLAVADVEERQQKELVESLKNQLADLSMLLAQYLETDQTDQQDLEQLNEQLIEMNQAIDVTEKDNEELKASLVSLRQERQSLNMTIRELEQVSDQLTQNNQKLYQEKASLEARVEKVKEFIDNHLDYLNQEHQLSYEAAVKEATAIDSIDKVQKTIRQLKREIENLGPINIAAIEDYDTLNERYQHLTEQEEDLLLAISQLQATMDEMDEEVIKRFSETFNQINHQFQRTFKKLFGGGEATLQLSDPTNMLTTGVDIIAQPPGKRKQQLALLSGGERALTAIALLFAILETKPVPFCILDEVEAALDDANVDRYGQYLKNFTENTQFIVITHRKGTMEHADVLYGVTMQESGVSKLASVRLSDAEYD